MAEKLTCSTKHVFFIFSFKTVFYISVTKHIKFNFAIMASGFKSQCWPHLKYYSDGISLPSLHIFGEGDKVIPTGILEYILINLLLYKKKRFQI